MNELSQGSSNGPLTPRHSDETRGDESDARLKRTRLLLAECHARIDSLVRVARELERAMPRLIASSDSDAGRRFQSGIDG